MSDVAVDARPADRWRGIAPYVQVLVVMGLLTLVPHIGLSNRHIHLAVICLIWSMAAYGLFVPYAFAGQMTVAIVTAWGIGAYATAIAIKYWHWSFLPCLALSVTAAFVAGLVMALPIFRTKGHYFVIVTFVIAEAVTVAARNWKVTVGNASSGITVRANIELLGWHFGGRISMFYLSLFVVTIMALSAVFIRSSHLGHRLASIRENEDLARSVGIRTTALKVLVLGIGGAYAGVAGTFYLYYLKHVDIDSFGVAQAITLILIIVIGGRNSIFGPLAGAAIAYFLPEVIKVDPDKLLIIYGVVLAVAVILMPDGVLGLWPAWRARVRSRRRAASARGAITASSATAAPPGGGSPSATLSTATGERVP
jgi:branched-chain amino acid transport system permease protein